MNVIIETERLLLYPFNENDTSLIIELLNTEGWLKYIGNKNIYTQQDALNYLKNGPLKSYKENGFGLSKMVLKNTMQPIGMCGLIKREGKNDIDLGFALLPNYIGYGYVIEIAKELILFAKNTLKIEKIIAVTLPFNIASIKVLEKLGFSFIENYTENNETLSLYRCIL